MKKMSFLFFLILLVSCQGEQKAVEKSEADKNVKKDTQQAKAESQEDCADEDEIEKKAFAKNNESSDPESLSLEGDGESGCSLDETL